ncbi:hypothetical protein LDENG_00187770 [Lucifuga dentata]|nr:hypothetical protein LDENG_00187770 [Lucifuga dentata]
MESDPPSKPSVAELAGRLKGHVLPMPTSNEEFRRRPPCSLKLQNQKDDNEESDKSNISPNPFKFKMKNSPIIEKLQANLALSPTTLLPSPKSPEVKLQPAPLSPVTPCSPLSHALQSSEEEDPISFESPPEGNTLPSVNKTRARLSFKRRPPSRHHRRSAGAFGSHLSQCELYSPKENGDRDNAAKEAESGQQASMKQAEKEEEEEEEERDRVKTEEEDNMVDQEEDQAAEEAQTSEGLEEKHLSDPHPAEPIEGNMKAEEDRQEVHEEAHRGGKDMGVNVFT